MKKPKNIFVVFILLVSLSACKKSTTPNPAIGSSQSPSLAGTKWILYQYKDASILNPILRNDTLIFSTDRNYLWNKTNDTYSLIDNKSGVLHLTLYGTSFGNISGTVSTNFISNGEIVGAPFSQLLAGGAQTYSMWFKQIN